VSKDRHNPLYGSDLNERVRRRQPNGDGRRVIGVRLSAAEAEAIHAAKPSGTPLSTYLRIAILRISTQKKSND
jgi:hypothetical protein